MTVKGMDALVRYLGSIKEAVQNDIFEEAANEWIEQDFKPVAKQLAPKVTGNLANSIDGNANPQQVRVFAEAEYAGWVEEGTTQKEARPFMKPAFDKTRRKLSQRTRDALRKRLR